MYYNARHRVACHRFLGAARLPGTRVGRGAADHSNDLSRTRRLIELETHQAVFTWVLQRVTEAGLLTGKMLGLDATTLEANAALRSIVRRDTEEPYQEFLTKLAQTSGIATPTRADLARINRSPSSPGTPIAGDHRP